MPARRKPSSDALPAAKKSALAKASPPIGASPALVTDLRQLILSAREQVARAVNSGLVLLYWSIGHRIRKDILKRDFYAEMCRIEKWNTRIREYMMRNEQGLAPTHHPNAPLLFASSFKRIN